MAVLVWSLLVGCHSACDEGFEPGGGNRCYAVGDTDTTPIDTDTDAGGDSLYDVWLATLEPCVASAGDGTLDLATGCADGACAGDTYGEFVAALGSTDCDSSSFDPSAFCTWPDGVHASFSDPDGDGVPADSARANGIGVDPPFDGTTTEGIGLGSSFSCYTELLGVPQQISIEPGENILGDMVTWFDPAFVSAVDGSFLGEKDGLVDSLYLGGGGG